MGRWLRPYQQTAIQRLTEDHQAHRRVLLVLPTGSGKTRTAATYVAREFLSRGKRVVWLAHSDELLDQAVETFVELYAGDDSGICRRYGRRDDRKSRAHAPLWFLNNLVQDGPKTCDLVVIDEAHRAAAKTYRDFLLRYRAHTPSGARALGLTATPYRRHEGELKPLTSLMFGRPQVPLFEAVAYRQSFNDLVAGGYLVPFVHHRLETRMHFDMRLRSDKSDLDGTSLDALDTPARNRLIVEHWRSRREQYGSTLVFVGTQDHAKNLAQAFGGDADYVIGGSGGEREQRRIVIERFEQGRLPVLVNVGIFREGVDVPRIQTVMLARPTASPGLFTQMVGRGARLHPGKLQFHLVDVHDQLGEFRDYLCGVELLESPSAAVESAISKRSDAISKVEQSSLRELAQDRRVLLHAALATDFDELMHYDGWITFRNARGEAVPVGTLHRKYDREFTQRHVTREGELRPESAEEFWLEAERAGSRPLWKCGRALGEGLIGTVRWFSTARADDVVDLVKTGLQLLKVPPGHARAELNDVIHRIEDRLAGWGFGELDTGRVIDAYASNPGAYSALLKIPTTVGPPELRLLTAPSWSVIGPLMPRAIDDALSSEDERRAQERLTVLEPDLASPTNALFDRLARAHSLDDVILDLHVASTKVCPQCGALASHRFCGFCGAPLA